MTSATIFGAPLSFSSEMREQWILVLSRCWVSLMGRPPGELHSDLSRMASLFGNGASAKTLKARVYDLPPASDEARRLPREICLLVDGCAVLAPEGRIFLAVLLDLRSGDSTEIDLVRQNEALNMAVQLRSQWHATWIGKQFDASLSAPALGAALFLLVNGSIGVKYAFTLSDDSVHDREIGAAVLPLLADFSRRLGGRVPETSTGVRGHWAFSQVSRLLGRHVDRTKSDVGGLIYVRPGREYSLLDELAGRLERTADAHQRREAVTGFVADYRRARGRLAAFGEMHEDPTRTRRIVERLAGLEAIS